MYVSNETKCSKSLSFIYNYSFVVFVVVDVVMRYPQDNSVNISL